ncbi:MAG TPA: dienelactone hydrolase family protein [Acidobacteriaceae bacterium]|nr:dienelactone hydrolase family protein [Acidobacteriaceae bacterium]
MDIERPDVKTKKTKRRRMMIGIGVVVILVAVAALLRRMETRPHHEYVTLKHDARAIQALVVSPKLRDKASVVVLVHEVYGLTDWAKEMADELANEGFIVIAPDFLSGDGPHGGGFDDFPSVGDRVSAVQNLNSDVVLEDLDAAVDYGKKLVNANGKIAVVGFSWGGWKSFAFATHRKDLSAVFVFYGTGPDDVTTITAPVYGFYGGADGAVSGSVPATTDEMKASGKFYDPVTYKGADHGFMRVAGEFLNTNRDNKTARDEAYTRLVKLLKQMEPQDN